MSDLFGIGTLLGSGFDLIGNLVSSSMARTSQERINRENVSSQERINAANVDAQKFINEQNIDFARAENEVMRNREDTAHQREVSDLMAAGLSPLHSTNGSSASGGVVPSLSASNQVAPVQDASGFVEAARLMSNGFDGLGDVSEAIFKENRADRRLDKMNDYDWRKTQVELDNSLLKLNKQLDSAEKIASDNRNSNASIEQSRILNDYKKFSENLTYLKNVHSDDMANISRQHRNQLQLDELRSVDSTFGHVRRFECKTQKEFDAQYRRVWTSINHFIQTNSIDISEYTTDQSQSGSVGSGLGASIPFMASGEANGSVTTNDAKQRKISGLDQYKHDIQTLIDKLGGYPYIVY